MKLKFSILLTLFICLLTFSTSAQQTISDITDADLSDVQMLITDTFPERKVTGKVVGFYDALEVNDSAVKILGDEKLQTIARELLESVRNSTTVDWTIKESVQATLRRNIRRILRKYGYPPDLQEKAVQTVIDQAKLLANDLASL